MYYHKLDLVASEVGCSIKVLEPMREHTTFRVGGPVDRFLEIGDESQLKAVQKVLIDTEISYYILGRGSNLLVSDRGIRGVVISLSKEFKSVGLIEGENGCAVRAGAAAPLITVCEFALKNNLSGLEFAYGIPGSFGGAVYMNAGAYDGEMANIVNSSRHLSTAGELCGFSGEELEFSYRKSAYTKTDNIILYADFVLERGDYKSIRENMDDLMKRRLSKQPYNEPSAGSTFKRPKGAYASALIQECGLKGINIGGAKVSEKHSGFIVNTGTATCNDILKLIDLVKEKVYVQTGFALECEVKMIGEGFEEM